MSPVDQTSLREAWAAWQPVVAAAASVARPPLLPHLRAVDLAQLADAPATLGLEGIPVSADAVREAFAACGAAAQEAGWPGAPPRTKGAPASAGAEEDLLRGWAAAIVLIRQDILHALEGDDLLDLLWAGAPRWHRALMQQAVWRGAFPADEAGIPRRRDQETGAPWRDLPGCLTALRELSAAEPSWQARAALLHLGLQMVRPWTVGNGLMARLVMNMVRAAAGHPWLVIPADRRAAYEEALAAALTERDADPFVALLASCTPSP